jgi:hypothetical protein
MAVTEVVVMKPSMGRWGIVVAGRSILAVVLVLCLAVVASACAGAGTAVQPPGSSASVSSPPPAASSPTVTPTGAATPIATRERGVWKPMASSPLPAMYTPTGTWDGKELIVSGRVCTGRAPYGHTVTAAYDPATDTWRMLPAYDGPGGCLEGGDTAVWDGREVLLLGVTNAAYDPATNHWRSLGGDAWGGNEVNVWTGRQTLGFGGGCCGDQAGMGPSYIPRANRWIDPPAGPMVGRHGAVGVWDGHEFIVSGGNRDVLKRKQNGSLVDLGWRNLWDAAAYDPATRSWRTLAAMPTIAGRTDTWRGTAVWDGSEMLVVSSFGNVAYDPTTDRWRSLPDMTYQRGDPAVVWTGSRMLVWGGATARGDGVPPYGEAFDPATSRWLSMPPSPLRHRYPAIAVWTGTQMIVWGGSSFNGAPLTDGATFTPSGS